jgi:ATP-binding cassette, subfamily C (CFTR/MRP), member 1
MSLLGFNELQSGRITVDNDDISAISREQLRVRLNVIPQEAFFLPGTVKWNLDPTERTSEAILQKSLTRVGLWDKVKGVGGLESDLDTSTWSQGEKQLLCLARALLVPSTVLILDEATSDVDDATEAIMMDVIRHEFHNCTVISVMHRLAKIQQFDRVAVLVHGRLVEVDTPQSLLARDSTFRMLYDSYTCGR